MPDPIPPLQTSIIQPSSTIIVGLSGGPDSIYLLYQLHAVRQQLDLTIIAAHLNHEWQESAILAVQVCQATCDTLHIPLVIKTISQLQFQPKWNGSQEEIGRLARRYFFESLAQKYQARAIALAHHQQDQQETFFIRLLRGASLTGLTGIKKIDGLYIRPILHTTKKEIVNYLHHKNIGYYTDPTNTSDLYLRNKIRNHVIPTLQATDDRFDQKLSCAMDHLALVDDFLEQHVQNIIKANQTKLGIDVALFLSLHTIIQQRILLNLIIKEQIRFTPSQNLFKEIVRFLEKSSKTTHVIHDSWMITKRKGFFALEKIKKFDKTL